MAHFRRASHFERRLLAPGLSATRKLAVDSRFRNKACEGANRKAEDCWVCNCENREDSVCSTRSGLRISNLQAEIARELIQAGVNVLIFNQRSIEEILEMILTLSRLVYAEARGLLLIEELRRGLDQIAEIAAGLPWRPACFSRNGTSP